MFAPNARHQKGQIMADQVTLYYSPMSRARTAHLMLEEIGEPYRLEPIDLTKGEQKQPKFLAINPMGKLPAIVHRGVVITETGAICTYLADAFPAARLAPALDEPLRGTYLRWMFFGAGCIDAALIDRMLGRPAPERVAALGYGTLETLVEVLAKAITPGPWILGDRFSAADVYLGSQIAFGLMTKTLDARPSFQAYAERLAARPAYQRFKDQADLFLKKMQATA
jgi:glutathione S-transferase